MSEQDEHDARPASDIAFTPAVKTIQERLGSRSGYRHMEEGQGWSRLVTPDLEEFIAERDSLYLGTASADGQPYIQHRGGKRGFLKVLDEKTVAFADFGGNRQYISMGNLSENDRAFLFLMDYPNQRRIKIWGRAEFVEDDDALLERLVDADYDARPERALVFHVEAWDANCPQHIAPRFTREELEPAVRELGRQNAALQERVDQLEAEIAESQGKRTVTRSEGSSSG